MTEEARKLLEDNELEGLIDRLRAEGYTTIKKLAALREEGFPVRTSELLNFRDMVGGAKKMVAEAKIVAKLQERNLQRFSADLKSRYSVRSLEELAVFDVSNLKTERPGYEPINEDEEKLFKAMQTEIVRMKAPFPALRLQEAASHEFGSRSKAQVKHGEVKAPQERLIPARKMTEEAKGLVTRHRFDALIDELARQNCTTMTDLAGLTWKDVDKNLKSFEVGRFNEMVLEAKLMVLEAKLESYGLGLYFGALREMGVRSLERLAETQAESLVTEEGFGGLSVERFSNMLKEMSETSGITTRQNQSGAEVIKPRTGLLVCFSHMTEVKVQVNGQEYTILQCDENFKLSRRVSSDFPDFVLIRQCILDVIGRIRANMSEVRRFLIAGTPGAGKTVSVIVWLYLAWKGELEMPFKHIIADLKVACIFLRRMDNGVWVEEWYDHNFFIANGIEDSNTVLYLYDASHNRQPLHIPYCSVVFSSPNLVRFKDFISTDLEIYYTPMWQWDEIEALHNVSTVLQKRAELCDVKHLFQLWGGLPRQIFAPKEIGERALKDVITGCNAVACVEILEKGNFLSYAENDFKQVRSRRFEVTDDGSYENAMVNVGSPHQRRSCGDVGQ